MKRQVAILMLFAFGNFIFTYKTHYCFFADGHRFHGDCQPGYHQQIKKYAAVGEMPPPSYFPKPFHCVEFQKDHVVYKQSLLPALPHIDIQCLSSNGIFNLAFKPDVIAFVPLPAFSCRGGPSLRTNILRGPPLV